MDDNKSLTEEERKIKEDFDKNHKGMFMDDDGIWKPVSERQSNENKQKRIEELLK